MPSTRVWLTTLVAGFLLSPTVASAENEADSTCTELLKKYQSAATVFGYPSDLVECLWKRAWEQGQADNTTASLDTARQALVIHQKEARWLQDYSAYSADTASDLESIIFWRATSLDRSHIDGRDVLDYGLSSIEYRRVQFHGDTTAQELLDLLTLTWNVCEMLASRGQHFYAVTLCKAVLADAGRCDLSQADAQVLKEMARLNMLLASMANNRHSEEPAVRLSLFDHYSDALRHLATAANIEAPDEEAETMFANALTDYCFNGILEFQDIGSGCKQIRELIKAAETSAPALLTPAVRFCLSEIESYVSYSVGDIKQAVETSKARFSNAAPGLKSILEKEWYLAGKGSLISYLLETGNVSVAEQELVYQRKVVETLKATDETNYFWWNTDVMRLQHLLEVLKNNPTAYKESWMAACTAHEVVLKDDPQSTPTAYFLFDLHQSRILGGAGAEDCSVSLAQMKSLYDRFYRGDRSRTARVAALDLHLAEICVLKHNIPLRARALALRFLKQLDAVPPSDRVIDHKFLRCFAAQLAGDESAANIARARLKQLGVASVWYELPSTSFWSFERLFK